MSTFTRGEKEYFLTDHRGNVLATVSDKKIPVDANNDGIIDYYVADIVTATDYAPFGSLLAGRQYRNTNQKLKYGYNGKENDNDVKGEGNQIDYGMRIYDPRLGRFLSVDPLAGKFTSLTPYQFASNTPISAIDIDGEEAEIIIDKVNKTITINFKFTYNDATMKAMKVAGVTLDDLKKGYNYYFTPESNGNPQALNKILDKSGLKKEELEKLLGGKAASGGPGYFNVDMKNGETYKVFSTLTIDNKLSTKNPTVFNLDKSKNANNEQDADGIHLIFNAGT